MRQQLINHWLLCYLWRGTWCCLFQSTFCNQSKFSKNVHYQCFCVYYKLKIIISIEFWSNKQPSLRWLAPCAIQNGNNLHYSNCVSFDAKESKKLNKKVEWNTFTETKALPFFTGRLTFSGIFLEKKHLYTYDIVVVSQAKMRKDGWVDVVEAYEGDLRLIY